MIYASFSRVVYVKSYEEFCTSMDIWQGAGSETRRTPAETKIVFQFLLAFNTGRRGVFINFNKDLAVVLNPSHAKAITSKGAIALADVERLLNVSMADSDDNWIKSWLKSEYGVNVKRITR